jgi:hypothetical protein
LRLAPLFLALLGLTATSASAASVVANGNLPDAITDREGVTHLVWNESRPADQGDLLHYCRIPRGATACQNVITRAPVVDGDGSTFDTEGPKVMINGFGRVIVLTHRNFKNVIYTSEDDGLTFTTGGGTVLGDVGDSYTGDGTPSVYDTADERIVTISAPTGGVRLQAAKLGGNTTQYAPLSNSDGYNPSVVFRGKDSFVAAWSDLDSTTHVRTFACAGCDPNDESKWTGDVTIPNADLPRLTSGPSGTFLLYRSVEQGAAQDKYFVRRIDGTAVGPPQLVADGPVTSARRDVVQDAGGNLHALFTDKDNGLAYRVSPDGGATWGDQQTLSPGPDFTIAAPRVTARTVDEGFTGLAVWESDDHSTPNPPILMAALPDLSVTLPKPPPGLPGPPGGGPAPTPPVPPAACRLLTFAAVDVIADACMTRSGDTYTATGGVRINGLRVELGSGKLKFDIRRRTITSSGAAVTVKLGDTVLFKRAIDLTLPKGSTASIGSFDVNGGGDLLGFPLKGSVAIKFRGGGVEVPVHLGLPALFGGVTGDVTVRADNVAGVHLRELHVKVGDALIGPLEIKDLFFDYDAESASWQGGANVILPPQPPGPSLKSQIAFVRGELDHLGAELTLPEPGVVLDPFAVTHLKKIRFALSTKPSLRLTGGVTVNAGPTIAGVAAVGVDGDLTFTLGDPAIFRVDGRVNLVSIPLGSAYFELRTNGYVGFGGHLGYAFSGFSATADLDGWLFKSAFSVGASASICLGDLGCAGGDVVFSSVGFAGCAHTFIADFGAGYKWGDGLDLMFSGCDVGPYKATAAAAQAGAPGARTLRFGKGVPSGFVAVTGQGAPPHVALVGPGGARIEDTPGTKAQTATSLAFHNPQTDTTYFVLKRPASGTWTVEPLPDSAPVTGVQAADGLQDPKVTGAVRRAAGGGRTRVLSYNVTPRPGQKVTFAEQGKGAARPIGGVAKAGRGTIRFQPADGPGGTRKIIALVSSYGKPRARLTVASYVAPPPPKPATPKRLKARRSGTRLVVSWARAANARRYEVRATLSDGRRLLVRQKGTRLTIPAFATKARATITVAGLKPDGTRGRKATVKVAAKKATKKPAARKKRR